MPLGYLIKSAVLLGIIAIALFVLMSYFIESGFMNMTFDTIIGIGATVFLGIFVLFFYMWAVKGTE